MPIDFANNTFSEIPIEGIEEDQAQWKPAQEFPPPPDPGPYTVFIKRVRDAREKMTDNGPRLVASYDAEILDGHFAGRMVTYNWISNVEFKTDDRGRTSTMLDLVKSAGVKGVVRTNMDFVKILNNMEDNRSFRFRIMLDWRGSCRTCFGNRLMELTGDDTVELAQAHASKEQKSEANKFAEKLRNARRFPVNKDNAAKRDSSVICPDCGDEIRAQAVITRYLAPSTN